MLFQIDFIDGKTEQCILDDDALAYAVCRSLGIDLRNVARINAEDRPKPAFSFYVAQRKFSLHNLNAYRLRAQADYDLLLNDKEQSQ